MTESDEKSNALHNSKNFVQIYVLSVTVSEAKGLRAADLGGHSDPYVKCEVFGLEDRELGSFETVVIEKNNDNPQWNHFHIFSFFDLPEMIRFEVWDRDESNFAGKDDELGMIELKLGSNGLNLFPVTEKTKKQESELSDLNQIDNKWYELQKMGKKGHKVKGDIKISIKAERLFPMETERRLNKMVTDLGALRQDKEQMEQEVNAKIDTLQKTIEELESRIKVLESEKSDLTAKLNAKTEENVELLKKEVSLSEEVTRLTTALAAAQSEKQTIETQISELKKEYEPLEGKYNVLNKDYNELLANNEKLKDDLEKARSAAAETSNDDGALAAAQSRIENLERDVDDKDDVIQQLRTTINELQNSAAGDKDGERQSLLGSEDKKKRKESTGCCTVM